MPLAPHPRNASECHDPRIHESANTDSCTERFMPNPATLVSTPGCDLSTGAEAMCIHQGDCVSLNSDQETYQVISIDGDHDRCWVRRWPLQRSEGSPVFEISLERIRQVG